MTVQNAAFICCTPPRHLPTSPSSQPVNILPFSLAPHASCVPLPAATPAAPPAAPLAGCWRFIEANRRSSTAFSAVLNDFLSQGSHAHVRQMWVRDAGVRFEQAAAHGRIWNSVIWNSVDAAGEVSHPNYMRERVEEVVRPPRARSLSSRPSAPGPIKRQTDAPSTRLFEAALTGRLAAALCVRHQAHWRPHKKLEGRRSISWWRCPRGSAPSCDRQCLCKLLSVT